MALSIEQIKDISNEISRCIADGSLKLPSPPEVYQKIVYAIDNDATMQEIERIINLSPAIAARVLQISNSSAYFGGAPCKSVHQALSKLGLSFVRNIVLCVCAKDFYKVKNKGLQVHLKEVWAHSVRLAVMSYITSKNLDLLQPDAAMSTALLHDIGMLPVFYYIEQHPDLAPNWRELYDLSGSLGETLCSYWNLGDTIRSVVYLHSGVALPTTEPSIQYVDLIGMIHAFQLMTECQEPPATMAAFIAKCDIEQTTYETLREEFRTEIAELERALGIS